MPEALCLLGSLSRTICNHLGIPKAKVLLDKFKGGETRVEIQESVRGKDVFIIQSGGGKGTKLSGALSS